MRILPYLWCGLALLLAFLLSLCLGAVPIPPLDLGRMALSRLARLERTWDPASETIFFDLRLPRAALFALTGAALGGSGAAYQGLFRNPLADPFLIGVAQGAGLGAIVAMVSGWPSSAIPAAALAGALATVAVVYLLARVGRAVPVTTLILSGIATGAFASALIHLLMVRQDLDLRRVINFLMGGFSLGGWTPVAVALPYAAAGLLALWALGHSLNVLQFGDEQACQLGLDVEKVKLVIIIASSLAAAASVASTGIIGFVGLIAPHVIRMLWGPDYRRLVPLSILGGGTLLLLADTAGRAAAPLRDLPVGIITALVGAPFFLFLLRRVRRSYW